MSKVTENIRQLHKEFVDNHGFEPTYADVIVKWHGSDALCHETFKMKDFDPENTENDPDDNGITFYVNGINDLCKLAEEKTEDFTIVDVEEFSKYMIY